MLKNYKSVLIIAFLVTGIIAFQAFAQKKPTPTGATNLKVLSKNLSDDQLDSVMHTFTKGLGVHCSECHVKVEGNPQEKPHMDFASDDNPKKDIARKMFMMVDSINNNFLAIAGKGMFEKISCVTCHLGHTKPIVSIDSLPKPTGR